MEDSFTTGESMEDMATLFRSVSLDVKVNISNVLKALHNSIRDRKLFDLIENFIYPGTLLFYLLLNYIRINFGLCKYVKRNKSTKTFILVRKLITLLIRKGFNILDSHNIHEASETFKEFYKLSNANLISIDTIKLLYRNTETTMDLNRFDIFQGFLPPLQKIL